MKQTSNRRPPRRSIELALEKLGVPKTDINNPVVTISMNNYVFKIIQSDLKMPSKLEVHNGEKIILLNNVTRSSKELLFDIYQLMAHIFIPNECVPLSTHDAEEWCKKNDIDISKNESLVFEMACDQYAIDKIKYGVASPKSVLKDIPLDAVRMMYPDFVLSLVTKLGRSLNEDIGYRRQYLAHLFEINTDISEDEKTNKISQKKLVELDKSINSLAKEYGFGDSPQTPNVEIPIMYDVCLHLKCNPNKMDSFDKSISRVLNDVEWKKLKLSDEIKEFVDSWVRPEYKRYCTMVSELERTPQRKLISQTLFEVVCKGILPDETLVERVRRNLIDDVDRPNLIGFSSYNERNGIKK